jgi:xanthine dehydrogenase/oxidase
LPLFCALKAEITIAYETEIEGQPSLRHETIVMQPELVQGGQLHIGPTVVVVSVLVRLSATDEHVGVFKAKQHSRKDDSNLSVAACLCVDERQGKIASTRAFVGGLSREPADLPLQVLIGSALNENTLLSEALMGRSAVLTAVGNRVASLTAGGDTHPGGRIAYRRVLTCAFVLKFLLRVCRGLGHQGDVSTSFLLDGLPSNVPVTGARLYPDTRETTPEPVGIPLKHLSANSHVAGTATFVADIGVPNGCVHAQLVTATRAHAHITGLDATLASEVPGFIRLVDGSTLGASNQATLEGYGELLAFDGQRGQVTFFGQAIAMVIAESEEAARAAARAVVVYYTDLPAVVTIAEAVEQGSLYDTTTPLFPPNFGKIEYGGVTNALATAAVVVEEDVSIGSQDHAYLRTT